MNDNGEQIPISFIVELSPRPPRHFHFTITPPRACFGNCTLVVTYPLVTIQGCPRGRDLCGLPILTLKDMWSVNTVHGQINMKCFSSSGQRMVFK